MDDFAPGTIGFLILCFGLLAFMVNSWTFVAFGVDKRRARLGEWRVPERTLLMLAFLGGWIGAKVAQGWFRHKTRKQPFCIMLNLIGVAHVLVIAAIVVTALHDDEHALLDLDVFTLKFDGGAPSLSDRVLPRRFGPGGDD